MQRIQGHIARRAAWLVLVTLMVVGGCGFIPERESEPELPITPPATLASLQQPDFSIRRMILEPRHDRPLFVEVWNAGGNLGILDTDELSETHGDVIAGMRVTVTMLLCSNGWDRGEEDFACESPSHRIRHFSMGVPMANTGYARTMPLNVSTAWQIHVMVEPFTGMNPNFVPVIERDYPARWNNQAVMKLVMHPSRDSWRGGRWHWPNADDTLPF